MSDQNKFDSWAVVELFGHQQIAGRVTEATIGGCAFLRVDVPDQPAVDARQFYGAQPAIPAYTRYFGNGAIYALNPCTEAAARGVAARIRATPAIPYDPRPAQPALTNQIFCDDEPPPFITTKGTTMIEMYPCSSSQIHAYGYDPETQTLALQFKRKGPDGTRIGGNYYTYANVPPELFDALCKAPSAGTWFGAVMKPFPDKYPYTKLTDEQVQALLEIEPQAPPVAGAAQP